MGQFSGKLNTLSTFYMLGKATWNVYKLYNTPSPQVAVSNNPYRPAEWIERGDKGTTEDNQELIQLIPNIAKRQKVFPGVTASQVKAGNAGNVAEERVIGYFFDAHLREYHTGSVRITDHPVHNGTSIADHAYNLPDILEIEIFVSDVMDEVVVGQFSEYETKSISAYEILRALKEQRMPLSIKTRLHFYENMLIERMVTNDDYKTSNSIKCSILFKQLITAYVNKELALSKDPQVTDEKKGNDPPKRPSPPAINQKYIDLKARRDIAVKNHQAQVGAQ